jgi:thiamine pyrophosphate-dependent acetolactate synthase large subunit-like protein
MNLKTILFLLFVILSETHVIAQINKVIRKDTASIEVKTKPAVINRKSLTPSDLKTEITGQLQQILKRHSHLPNEESTWKSIRDESLDLLHTYYRNGRLAGNQPYEAYYIKMGPDTMTATDITNHRMVLVAGIATKKPYEFETIRILN